MLSGCDPQQLLALREAITAVMARRQAAAPGRPPLAAISNVAQARHDAAALYALMFGCLSRITTA